MKQIRMLLTAAFTGWMSLHALSAQVLMIRPEIVAKSSTVYLRDILEDTASLPVSWLDRKVFDAPPCMDARDYDLTAIAYILQKYPDMGAASLNGPANVRVYRAKRLIQQEELHVAIEDFVATEEAPDGDYRIDFRRSNRKVWIPSGQTEVRVRKSRSSNADRFSDTYINDIYVEGQKVCSVPVHAAVVQLYDVWVAKSNLAQGHILQHDDLEIQKMELSAKGKQRILTAEDITGMEISRTILNGDPILKNYLRSPLCARKGDFITVVAQTGNLKVAVKAKALSTGRLGERILCNNQRSNRQFLVELTGINKAKLARL
ncbi:MAG: flagellar basal body P-ring formation protein FlgA [Spartobacteria bacterium]|nr:flagellar basal body P-ring formation protein FlgA [Spartobacteria bacterium]